MELIDILRVVRRWLWLIVAIVVVSQLALWLGMRSADPVYTASVRLQISTPQREEVALYDEYRSIGLRDEITVAINNFVELLQSDEVTDRTVSKLGLVGDDAGYELEARSVADADFVDLTVKARTSALAADIANTHAAVAIAYYGELRAQATRAEMELLANQLETAGGVFQASEKTFSEFRNANGIFSLESQLSTQEKLLEQLQLTRDEFVLQAAASITATEAITATTVDPISEVDRLIAQRQGELDRFTALVPQYNVLEQKVEQARADYQHLLKKYSEAELKVTAVQAANFIQIIQPAAAPDKPDSDWPMMAVLALVGSLGLGVVLAFLLEYVSGLKASSAEADDAAPADRREPSAPGGGKELPSLPRWRLNRS